MFQQAIWNDSDIWWSAQSKHLLVTAAIRTLKLWMTQLRPAAGMRLMLFFNSCSVRGVVFTEFSFEGPPRVVVRIRHLWWVGRLWVVRPLRNESITWEMSSQQLQSTIRCMQCCTILLDDWIDSDFLIPSQCWKESSLQHVHISMFWLSLFVRVRSQKNKKVLLCSPVR